MQKQPSKTAATSILISAGMLFAASLLTKATSNIMTSTMLGTAGIFCCWFGCLGWYRTPNLAQRALFASITTLIVAIVWGTATKYAGTPPYHPPKQSQHTEGKSAGHTQQNAIAKALTQAAWAQAQPWIEKQQWQIAQSLLINSFNTGTGLNKTNAALFQQLQKTGNPQWKQTLEKNRNQAIARLQKKARNSLANQTNAIPKLIQEIKSKAWQASKADREAGRWAEAKTLAENRVRFPQNMGTNSTLSKKLANNPGAGWNNAIEHAVQQIDQKITWAYHQTTQTNTIKK